MHTFLWPWIWSQNDIFTIPLVFLTQIKTLIAAIRLWLKSQITQRLVPIRRRLEIAAYNDFRETGYEMSQRGWIASASPARGYISSWSVSFALITVKVWKQHAFCCIWRDFFSRPFWPAHITVKSGCCFGNKSPPRAHHQKGLAASAASAQRKSG